MAIMIPERPYYMDPKSNEDLIFDSLQKYLPDDYYVFHSFRIYREKGDTVQDKEFDFVIYCRNKGIMVIEAKAGNVYCKDGVWFYQSGIKMKHGGPFKQVIANKWALYDFIKDSTSVPYLADKCKFCSAVWFLGLRRDELTKMPVPADVDKKMILTLESLENPLSEIESIFAMKRFGDPDTNLNDIEHRDMILKALCPEFNIVPTETYAIDLKKTVFHRLLKEQQIVLNFLMEQRTVAISGKAGTGKTLIAVEKAIRNANNGDKVLFLCFNINLRDYLAKKFKNENITFMTLAKFACEECNTTKTDLNKLYEKLEEYYFNNNFPYNHIVVDEGQDFGIEEIEENKILTMLKMIIDSKGEGSTFYVFYDKLQLIQSSQLPQLIQDIDCKISLYKNCRNTENIAETSLRPISEHKPEVSDFAIKGDIARVYFSDSKNTSNYIDVILNRYKNEGVKDVAILTCKTEETSSISDKIVKGYYRKNYRFSTCRRFKGLEADAIILIDVEESTFEEQNKLRFYVGTSRARIYLDIVANLSDESCTNVLKNRLGVKKKIKNPKKDFASRLNATVASI